MRKFVSILIIFNFLAACAVKEPVFIKDGVRYGLTSGLFRERWWNFYERGVSFSEGAFFEEAIKDFKQAMKKRQDDQWKARTYGMHFVNYFPHRELGIVYYRINHYKDAIRELETSLGTAENAKAKYFLNRARKSLLETTGKDLYPPSLQFAQPIEGTITNRFTVTFSGIAADDQYVSSVKINGYIFPLELSVKQFEFEKDVKLTEGINNIRVAAEDLTGKATERIITITSDRQGPIITIEDLQDIGKKSKIQGFVTDDTGVSYFAVNGREIPFHSPMEFPYKQEVEDGIVRIEARDMAGNITVAMISSVKKASFHSHLPRLASLVNVPISTAGNNPVYDDSSDCWAMDFGNLIDTSSPVFKIGGLSHFQEVYDDEIEISGNVSDDSRIKSLRINGEQILRKRGKKIYFAKLFELEPGENQFVLEAYDSFGNKGTKKIIIYRKIHKVRQIGSRMSIAVFPLKRESGFSVAGAAVYDNLISAFVNQGRFNVVDRGKLDAVLQEHKISSTDLVDKRKAIEIGRIIAADGIITGTILESESSIEVVAHLIDSETSVVLSSNDVFDEDRSLRSVKSLLERLVYKFKRDFPLLEGLIIEINGREISVDLGEEKRVKKYAKLILFREGPEKTHPDTGRVLGSEALELGEAKIRDVFEEFSKATVIQRSDELKVRDGVITK